MTSRYIQTAGGTQVGKPWLSPSPSRCDLCHDSITSSFYDARVPRFGCWATLCPSCFQHFGCKLGIGLGQRYAKETA